MSTIKLKEITTLADIFFTKQEEKLANNEIILEELLLEQLSLWDELHQCLKDERALIRKATVEGLDSINEQKQNLVTEIEEVHEDIMLLLTEYYGTEPQKPLTIEHLLPLVPNKDHSRLHQLYSSIRQTKSEITKMVKENKFLVEDCLNFIDKMVDMITTGGNRNTLYDTQMKLENKRLNNILLHMEV